MTTSKKIAQIKMELTVAHNDYEKRLNTYAFFKVSNHELSEDLVQATFMKTWNYLVKGGEIKIIKAFLYHILNDLIIDQYRKKKNQTISLDVLRAKGFEPSANDSKRLFNFLDGKTALLLIPLLPKKYQKVIRMKYLQDLSLKEISNHTGQAKNTIAVQAYRGLKKLKLLYNPA